MGRHHGYIYYEGDAYLGFVNPFVDVHVDNPSLVQLTQKPLKGIPPHAIKKMDDASEVFKNMSKGIFEGLDETFQDMLPLLTEHVKQQRKRLGGDWSLAHALFSRAQREQAVELLDGDVVFIVLNMTQECQSKRLAQRHGDTGLNLDFLDKMFKLYEPAGEDEKNAFNVTVTEDMSQEDVIEKVQEIVRNL